MPWETIEVERSRTFIPPEATYLANQFRSAAEKATELADQCDQTQYTLDETWEGKSQQVFFEERREQSNLLRRFAVELTMAANRIGSIEVTVWETVQKRIWVPELSSQEE
jgi:uncharacterized protein YukE